MCSQHPQSVHFNHTSTADSMSGLLAARLNQLIRMHVHSCACIQISKLLLDARRPRASQQLPCARSVETHCPRQSSIPTIPTRKRGSTACASRATASITGIRTQSRRSSSAMQRPSSSGTMQPRQPAHRQPQRKSALSASSCCQRSSSRATPWAKAVCKHTAPAATLTGKGRGRPQTGC